MNQENIVEILYFIKGTFKYRWIALIVAWIVAISGWIFVAKMPDKYVSEARVHVDTESMLQPLLRGMTVTNNLDAQIELMRQLMFTQQNLSEIARIADVDVVNMDPIERIEYFDNLKSKITIKGSRKSPIFYISYSSVNPQVAKNIVNAILTVFSERAQKTNFSDVDNASRFIDEQIAEYETRLRDAEKAREEFRRINFGLLPEDTVVGVMGRIDRMIQEREAAELLLQETISKRETIEQQLQEALQISDTSQLPDVETPEDVQIRELNDKKTLLLLKYTENHPDILAINQAIDEWENRKEKNNNSMEENEDEALMMEHPYISELKTALNQTEAEEASGRSRLKVIGERIDKLKEEQSIRLRVETELQSLNRDYDTLEKNYNTLVGRREQVHITKNIDDRAISLRFNIADPPNKPLKPSEPNRIVLVSTVYAGSLAAGFGIAFLIYFLRPTFVTTRQISVQTGLAVLGGVSMQGENERKKINFSSVLFFFGFLLLTLLFFVVLSIEVSREYDGVMKGVIDQMKEVSSSYLQELL